MSGREGEEEQSYGRLRKTDKSNCGRALSTYDSGSGPRIASSSAAMQLTGWEWLTCLPNHFHWKTYIQNLPICLRDSASNMHRWRWTDSRTFFFNFLQQRMCCGSSSSWVVISFGAKHQVIVSFVSSSEYCTSSCVTARFRFQSICTYVPLFLPPLCSLEIVLSTFSARSFVVFISRSKSVLAGGELAMGTEAVKILLAGKGECAKWENHVAIDWAEWWFERWIE